MQFDGDTDFSTLLSDFTTHLGANPSILDSIRQYRISDISDVQRLAMTKADPGSWKDPIDIDNFLLMFAFACRSLSTIEDSRRTRRVPEVHEELANHISHYEEQASRFEEQIYEHNTRIRGITTNMNNISAKHVSPKCSSTHSTDTSLRKLGASRSKSTRESFRRVCLNCKRRTVKGGLIKR